LELLKELILLFVGEENFEIYFGLFLDDIFIRFFIALCQKRWAVCTAHPSFIHNS